MSRVKIASHSFLIQNFHEFFNLLLRQKELALRSTGDNGPPKLKSLAEELESPTESLEEQIEELENSTANSERQTEDTGNPLVNTIQRRLSILLEEQAIGSTLQVGEFATSSYQDALYAMVAFADEVFLNIPWAGQKQWEDNLLESRFFQTQIAGELLFQKIEELISTNDPMRADLAIIYLLILGLGFKGRFRGEDEDRERLSLYRRQLYIMINRHPSTLYDPGRHHLVQDCYEHVLDSTLSKGLPEIRMWLLTFMGILGVYLFASTVLWYKLVRDMDESIGNILQQAQQMGLS